MCHILQFSTFTEVVESTNFLGIREAYIIIPALLSVVMFNHGWVNTLSIISIVTILSQGQDYLNNLIQLSETITVFISRGGLVATDVIQALQFLGPLIRNLGSVIWALPYFIGFLQGVGFEGYAEQAILLHHNLNEIYSVYLDLMRELQTILDNIQLPQPQQPN